MTSDNDTYHEIRALWFEDDGVTIKKRGKRHQRQASITKLIALWNKLHPTRPPIIKLCCTPDVYNLLGDIHRKLYP